VSIADLFDAQAIEPNIDQLRFNLFNPESGTQRLKEIPLQNFRFGARVSLDEGLRRLRAFRPQ
jgi:hypothetical protein